MEKNQKIIIIGLIIVIIALVAGIAYMFMGNSLTGNGGGNVPDGMKMYDFNSEFKMAVPENAKFLKEWNGNDGFGIVNGYSYLDKDNEFGVLYLNSPLVTHELVNSSVQMANNSGNCTFEFDGNHIIVHYLKADGKVGSSNNDTHFKEEIMIQRGHQMIVISGNDLELIKSMANTVKFYE